eukprot:COSAG05_NODE_156_length_15696_cov_359.955440_24_plen_114_part_00
MLQINKYDNIHINTCVAEDTDCVGRSRYGHVCTGCHKGMCGPQQCDRPSRFPPLPRGKLSLSRRERPKMLFDKNGAPTHLFNSADPGGTVVPPNPGWQHNSRPFTMVTEILES